VLHFSGADFRCGIRPYDPQRYNATVEHLFSAFSRMSLAQVVREIDREFPGRDYSLRDLFLDERRHVANHLLRETMQRYESDYLQIYEANRRLIDFLREIDSPVPRPLQVAADVAMTRAVLQTVRALAADRIDVHAAEADLVGLAQVASRLNARIDTAVVRAPFHAALQQAFDRALSGRRESAAHVAELIDLSGRLGLHLDLWALQNALWERVRNVSLERDALARIGQSLWFDEATLLARRASAKEAPAPAAAAAAAGATAAA
jgi:hypothetical protein